MKFQVVHKTDNQFISLWPASAQAASGLERQHVLYIITRGTPLD